MKKALITGVTGQDGSYLAELLLEKGYQVYGIIRRTSNFNTQRINHIFDKLHLIYGDLLDPGIVQQIIDIQPNEIYNLGAQSHVKVSFEIPDYTINSIVLGTLRILEAARKIPEVRVYQASSSEMFGSSPSPQNENTLFQPQSPYACAKVCAYDLTRNYRDAYGLFASNGILFNHESPRRGETFVTKKIIRGAVELAKGGNKVLELGNLDSKRDWGYAKDYCEAMYKILQYKKSDDFVIATNESHSVREFLTTTFKFLGIKLVSQGEGLKEKIYDEETGKLLVKINKKYFRPSEVDDLKGDYSKAKKLLKWEPQIRFKELIKKMLDEQTNEKK